MNWRERLSTIKVGDTVKCIRPENPRKNMENSGGHGWSNGYVFVVASFTDIGDDGNKIVWPTGGGSGVYIDYVRKVS